MSTEYVYTLGDILIKPYEFSKDNKSQHNKGIK